MSDSKNKHLSFMKRKYFINQGFQIRFIAYTVFIAFTVVLSVFLTSNFFFKSFAEKGAGMGLNPGHIFFTFIEQQQAFMNSLLVGLSLFYILILILFGIILSHRVAGPMHHLHRHMLDVSQGKTTSPLHFRKRDFFQELAQSYNAQYDYLCRGSKGKESAS